MQTTSTFSVAGRCPRTGALGAIVTSSSPAVGARCVRIKSDTGVILTQNVTDPRLAEVGLSVLAHGFDAQASLRAMTGSSSYPEYRQLAVVDSRGGSAVYTGDKALGVHGEYCMGDVACIGNLLSDAGIPNAMGRHFLKQEGELPDRLISAIELGFAMGGELDQEHSIALLVYHKDAGFAYVDLRVDFSDNPLDDLKRLWQIYGPQAEAYKLRAVDPRQAPSYGVKGDD